MKPSEVHIAARPLSVFADVLGPERMAMLEQAAAVARATLQGRTVWNVNSTSTGGGVAEMLHPLLAYGRGEGIDTRWLVVEGDPEFFRVTKRLHNALHGAIGDGSELDDAARRHYTNVLHTNARELAAVVRAGDVVLLHDPQTAGLVDEMKRIGAITVWRSHIGSDAANVEVDRAWAFLRPFLHRADAYVFSRRAYVPTWLTERVHIIAPSIDPFSTKNVHLDSSVAQAIAAHVGVIAPTAATGRVQPLFTRRDGAPGRVDRHADIVRAGPAPSPDTPLVVQVSRWDRLKDMRGVLEGFAEHVLSGLDAHLALVGPNVSDVADDPEGAEVLDECIGAWQALPHAARGRIQLVCLPMEDAEENAAIVNAIQRHAAVVVQKSLAEGFGLTVAEAMWKHRPVVASAVGGIRDQLVDGESGVLLDEPRDLAAFGAAVRTVLHDSGFAARLGAAAHRRVLDDFLGSRHLMQYGELLTGLVAG